MITAIFNTVILVSLGLVHLYWLFGGTWGWQAALPEKNGQKVLDPKPVDTLLVAAGLIGFGLFHLHKIGWLALALPSWVNQSGLWIIASIFFLRAIGDFRYVGFFKRIKDSLFAQWDTQFFIPLCLLIGSNSIITELIIN